MKTRWFVLPVLIALFMTGACSVEELDLAQEKEFSQELVFMAQSGELETKTAFQSDETSIWWSPADEISIFYGASEGSKFTSTNTEEVAKAEFHGTLNVFTGESEAGEAYYFWAVYPYSSANSCDGSSVTVTLSDQQIAKAGTFAPNTNISIAKSTGLNLAFFNTCSWFRFSLKKEGVKRVVFRGNNNEDVAGQFSVSMDGDGRPTAPTVLDGKKEIVLTMPEDAAFATGQMYYITLLPQVFQSGFTVTFETDGETGSRSISATATYLRSKYNTGVEFDKNVEYTKTIPANNEIWYTSVGDVVVNPYSQCDWVTMDRIESNTVTDGIGKIVFKNDISEIPSNAFYQHLYSGPLKTVVLPNSVNRIRTKAFYGCNCLESIRIPDGLTQIEDYAFYRCYRLKSMVIPSSLTSLGVNVFTDCDNLRTLTLYSSAAFHMNGLAYLLKCKSIDQIKGPFATEDGKYAIINDSVAMVAGYNMSTATIPDGITSINPYVFYENSYLHTVSLPGSINTIGTEAFYGCRNLDYVELNAATPPTAGEVFEETNECPIIVPSSSVSTYKEAWPAYRVRIGSSLDDVPVLLSKDGRANCYMINAAGQYRFIANKKGNSSESIYLYTNQSPSSSSVEVLWESVYNMSSYQFTHESGTLISNISFDNEEIVFTATGNEGNALVALRGSGGTILWSWHLWFVNEDVNGLSVNTIMDRNLGAIWSDYIDLGYTRIEVGTYGLLYQKGRKDPFVGRDSYLWNYQITTTDNSTASKNPTTLYGSYNGTWSNYPSGWNTNKDMNDPCPPGWKIPSISDLSSGWSFTAYNNTNPVSKVRDFNEIDDYYFNGVFFPCAGNIKIVNGNNDYRFEYEPYWSWDSDDDAGFEGYGYYYLSDGYIAMENGYNCTFDFGINSFSNNNDLSRAFSVRCCKEQ